MSDDNLERLYRAANPAEAQMLADALGAEDIEAVWEQTPSPFDGVGQIGDVEVFVRQGDFNEARLILDRFLSEKADGQE